MTGRLKTGARQTKAACLSALIASFVLVAMHPATASSAPQGPWVLPATDLSARGGNALAPQIAFGTDGTATAVWNRSVGGGNYIVQATTRPPGGSFGAPVDLSLPDSNTSYPQVATTPDGTTIVVWMHLKGGSYAVQAAIRPAGGSFGAPVNLSAPSTDPMLPDLAVGPDGTAIAVWPRFNGSDWIAQASTRPAGGSFGPAEDLSAPGGFAGDTRVVFGPDSMASVVWQLWADSQTRIQAATRPPDGEFGAPVDLTAPAPGHQVNFPQVAAGPDGITAVWLHTFGVSSIVQVATQPPGGSFGSPLDLSAPDRHAGSPQIAVGQDGTAAAIWTWPDEQGHKTIQAAIRPPGGAFGTPVELTAPGRSVDRPQVSVAPDGTITAIWYRWDGENNIVQTSTRPPNGSFGATVDLSAAGQNAVDPQVAIAMDGSATAVWRLGSVGNLIIQSASTARPRPLPERKATTPSCRKAKLKLGKFRAIRRSGTGILKVRVGSSGRVILRGSKQVRRTAKVLKRPGMTRLRVRAKGRTLRRLNRRGAVKVRVRVTFRPSNRACPAKNKTRKVRLIR